MRKSTFLFVIMTTFWVGVANAATLTVGSGQTYSTIAAAITAATSGDIIRIYGGPYTEKNLMFATTDKSLTFIGDGKDATIIRANANSYTTGASNSAVFNIPSPTTGARSITFQDLTISNGYNSGSGGGMRCNSGVTYTTTLSFTNVGFTNNWAAPSSTASGGAISLTGNFNTYFSNCSITGNKISTTGANYGGAIAITSGTQTISFTGCTISGNSTHNATSGSGAGGFLSIGAVAGSVSVTITNTNISSNVAGSAGGGAIAFLNSNTTTPINFTISNSTLSGNYTTGNGGAIMLAAGANASTAVNHSLSITNSTLYGNYTSGASKNGGAIFFATAATQTTAPTQSITLNHVSIVNNGTASGTGGDGVSILSTGGYSTNLLINNSIIMGNYNNYPTNTTSTWQVGTDAAAQTKINTTGSGSVVTNSILGVHPTNSWGVTTGNTSDNDFNNKIDATIGGLAFVGSLSADATPVLKFTKGSIARNYVATNKISVSNDELNTARVGNPDAGAWEYPYAVYTIAASAGTGGTVTSGAGDYDNGASCTVVASANTGYNFVNWTENGTEVSTSTSYNFTVSGGRTLVANFAASATPSLAISSGSTLTNFIYPFATGPSAEQHFTVTGANLSSDISISAASTDYEVSTTSGSGFGTTASISKDGTVTDVPVYVRLKAGLTANTAYNSEGITVSTTGASDQIVTCSGRVTDALPTTAATSASATNVLHTTADLSWTAGNGAKYLVLYSTYNDVASAYPPVNGTTYTVGSTTHAGYIVGYVGSATSASLSGLTAGTTNYFAVFTYNDNSGSGGYESYLTSSPATANALTIAASSASDYFKTTTSGNWATTSIWNSSANGTDGWHLASIAPGASATSALITSAGSPVTASAEINATTIKMDDNTKFIWNGTVDFGTSTTKKAFVGGTTVNFDAQTSSASTTTSNYYINFAGTGNSTSTINLGLGTASQSGTTNFNLLGVAQANLPAGVQLNVTNNTGGTARLQIPRDALTSRKLNLGTGVVITRGDAQGGVYSIGELSGNGILEGENSTNAGKEITYTIGGSNTDCTFAGTLRQYNGSASNNNVNIDKQGSAKLTLSGSSSHKGTVTVTAGTLELTGSMTGITTATIASGATLNIAPGKQLTVSTSLVNNGTLNLNSDINGTATFVNTATNGSTATATVQQYLPTGRNWYVGVPINTTITTVAASNLTAAGATSVAYWDETSGAWVPDYAGNLERGRGYIAVSNAGTSTNNISFTGTLNDGNVDVAVSRTVGKTKEGFNLISNPYPSYLNAMTAINAKSANMETTIWYRTKGTSYSFETVNTASGEGTNGVTGYIPPMQAFWVRVKPNADPLLNNSETLTFTNAMRSHANPTGVTTTLMKSKSVVEPAKIRLQISNGVNTDETLIYTNSEASNDFDQYDSHKMSNDNAAIPEIYTTIGSEQLVINGFNQLPVNVEIPLGFKTGQSSNFVLKATKIQNINDGTVLVLNDKLKNTATVLNDSTSYIFNSDVVTTTDRFSLVLKTTGVNTDLSATKSENTDWMVFCNANKAIELMGVGIGNQVTVYNTLGQKVLEQTCSSQLMTLKGNIARGTYLIIANGITKKFIIK